MKKAVVVVMTLLMVLAGAVYAQEQSGEFLGTVLLEDGSTVPGVTIVVKGTNLVGTRTSVSDENGKYRFPSLPPGVYTITFTMEGFKQVIRKGVVLEVGKTFKIDGVMQTGAMQEEIFVEGAAPIVDVRKSAISTNMTKEVISKLPKGRNFTGVITTQAGVNYELGGYSFDGASGSENTYFVDGMNTTTMETGTSGQRVDYDSVEEVQIKSSGYAAEYGGSMGGVVSVITKSGGNEFHGDITAYYLNNKLSGNPRKILMLNPDDETEAIYYKPKKDKYTSFEPGFSVGGYIIKDRLWFFTSFIPQFQNTDRPGVFRENPEHNGETFNFKRRRLKGSAKITGAITNNIRLSLSASVSHSKTEGGLPDRTGSTTYTNAVAGRDLGRTYPGITLAGSLDYSIGNNAFLNISGGYYRTNAFDSGNKAAPELRILFQNSNSHIPGVEHHERYWSNISWAQLNADVRDIADRKSLKGDFTYYFNAAGEHVAKIGLAWSNVGLDKLSGVADEYWRFYWKNGDRYDTFKKSDGTVVPLDYGYVRSYIYGEKGKLDTDRWSLYLQDSWTIGNNLTINYGVRFEKEDMPSFDRDHPESAFKFGFFDKIAPRLGFAYDMKGDGKNKIFGSFGIYYDVMKLSMAVGSFGGAQYKRAYYNIKDPDWTKYYNQTSVIYTGSTAPILGGELLELENLRVPSFDLVQPNMKPYSKLELSLGYQRMLKDDLSMTVRLLHNRILNAIEDIGVKIGSDEHYFIGNPGSEWINNQYKKSSEEGHIPEGRTCPSPKRKYYSLQISLDKKFSNNWLGGFSLTFSRLTGNFSGLASTDEGGRQDPNVARYFDAWYAHYDSQLNENDGLLPTDRPFQAKIYGAYTFDFGLTVGVNIAAQTGTPVSRTMEINGQDGYYPDGRHSDGRTPFTWWTDAYVEYEVKLSGSVRLNLNANISNITNNSTATAISNNMTVEKVNMTNDEIIKGFNAEELMEANGYAKDPRFLMKYGFQSPISVRFGAKLSF